MSRHIHGHVQTGRNVCAAATTINLLLVVYSSYSTRIPFIIGVSRTRVSFHSSKRMLVVAWEKQSDRVLLYDLLWIWTARLDDSSSWWKKTLNLVDDEASMPRQSTYISFWIKRALSGLEHLRGITFMVAWYRSVSTSVSWLWLGNSWNNWCYGTSPQKCFRANDLVHLQYQSARDIKLRVLNIRNAIWTLCLSFAGLNFQTISPPSPTNYVFLLENVSFITPDICILDAYSHN